MRRKLMVTTLLGTALAFIGIACLIQSGTAEPQPAAPVAFAPAGKPATPLPMAQVVLFSSGVGYFQREGEVEGNARVDLSFPASDVNDLLKSLVLQDLGGGKISAISYDSRDPVEKTLKSFALDLTYNPSFGQLLNQARGEKVEVVLQQGNNSQPATMTGIIVGMESRKVKDSDVELLNLLCAEGIRNVPLDHVQRVRLLNPVLDGEFRRALEVLATVHDTQKKTVNLAFSGQGKRSVRVGYVVENPIWKTSYRLVFGKDGKAALQGWAMVENTQDEDWNNVRVVLVSGRPISFQMDLYEPLFIPRPTVEPEKFASLRPPTYNGNMNANMGDAIVPGAPSPPTGFGGMGGFGGQGGGMGMPAANRYQGGNQFGNLGGQIGMQGGNPFGGQSVNQQALQQAVPRLTYEELQQRRQDQKAAEDDAKKVGSALAALNPTQGVASVASAEEIGDFFQYVIDEKVSLARQKSALLPIVASAVAGTKVSIFNDSVHAKFPLLGYKLKNTTNHHLMQGPITVYDGGSYAGDSRIMDLQPNEERLISYAVDLGVEVKAESNNTLTELVSVKLLKGVLFAAHKVRMTKTYLMKNRSEHDRSLLVEHPVQSDWKLVTPEKPSERSRDVYRFALDVKAGKSATLLVTEEQTRVDRIELTGADDRTIVRFQNHNVSSAKVAEALQKTIAQRQGLAVTRRELAQLETKLKQITDDQARLRANLDKVPPTSAAYKRYLEKFDTQETEIEKLQDQRMLKQDAMEKEQKDYEDSLAELTVG